MCMYIYIYIYVYVYIHLKSQVGLEVGHRLAVRLELLASVCGQNGVNENGAAAKGTDFDRLGRRMRPGTFAKIKVV